MGPTWRASATGRDLACYYKSKLKKVFVYMKKGPALSGQISPLGELKICRLEAVISLRYLNECVT